MRTLNINDINELKKIHSHFYEKEFEFPNFFENYLCAFVVEDNDKIITAGGVRTIPEIILITDKDQSVKMRVSGLYKALQISNHICERNNYKHLHAFVQDDKWLGQLLRSGFRSTKGKSVVIDVG